MIQASPAPSKSRAAMASSSSKASSSTGKGSYAKAGGVQGVYKTIGKRNAPIRPVIRPIPPPPPLEEAPQTPPSPKVPVPPNRPPWVDVVAASAGAEEAQMQQVGRMHTQRWNI